jgi:hypothetical protein
MLMILAFLATLAYTGELIDSTNGSEYVDALYGLTENMDCEGMTDSWEETRELMDSLFVEAPEYYYHPAVMQPLHLRWGIDTVVVSKTVRSSLYKSLGERQYLKWCKLWNVYTK